MKKIYPNKRDLSDRHKRRIIRRISKAKRSAEKQMSKTNSKHCFGEAIRNHRLKNYFAWQEAQRRREKEIHGSYFRGGTEYDFAMAELTCLACKHRRGK